MIRVSYGRHFSKSGPNNCEELEKFLGFAGYYQHFVKGYSKIAKPLNALKSGCSRSRKRVKIYKRPFPKGPVNSRVPFDDEWTIECDLAFKVLVEALASSPILAFADP